MKNQSLLALHFRKLLSTIFYSVLILLVSFSCSSSDQSLKVSGFRFVFEDNDYFIRSIYCPDSPQSCNHLIGKDFEAVDINQDRVIDKIVKGDFTIPEAQRIYSYSLDLLKKQNKLSEVNKSNEHFKFVLEKANIIFEITSFQPEIGNPFNQFKVVEKRVTESNSISLFNDKNSNGSLDEKLDGTLEIMEAQKQYQATIEAGIRADRVEKVNGKIRVK